MQLSRDLSAGLPGVAIAGRSAGAEVVTSHGGDVYEHNIRLQRPAIVEHAAGLRSASRIVAISRFTRDGSPGSAGGGTAHGRSPNGVRLASHAESVQRPKNWDDSLERSRYAVFVGRLKYRKGVDVLLQALARTPAGGGVELAIVGDGEERAALEVLANQLDLNERVRFSAR